MKNTICIIIVIFFTLVGCKKSEDRSCFKSAGSIVTIDFPLENFNELFLYQNLSYHLVPDSVNFARVTGGENLVKHLGYVYEENTLSISNENKCNFLRSYSHKIHVELHYKSIQRIEYMGSMNLTNNQSVEGEYLNLFINKGSGSVDLNLNTQYCNANVVEGVGDYTLRGQVGYGHFQLEDNGFADISELNVTGAIEITSRSLGIMKCRADGVPLKVTIIGTGDVWYYGTPSSIELNQLGSGQLIHQGN